MLPDGRLEVPDGAEIEVGSWSNARRAREHAEAERYLELREAQWRGLIPRISEQATRDEARKQALEMMRLGSHATGPSDAGQMDAET